MARYSSRRLWSGWSIDGGIGELLAADGKRRQRGVVVVVAGLIPETGGGGHGSGHARFAEQFLEQVFGKTQPAARRLEFSAPRLRSSHSSFAGQ